jgi:hypothetical protein
MSQTIQLARQSFVAAMQRETSGTDLARYTAVLDALIAWSAKHADRLTFRPAGKRGDAIRFERTKTKEAFWSAQVTRADAPKLEIHLPAARPLSAEDRAATMQTLNAHSREVLVEGERLRIGFGALKNAAALAAALDVMERLIADAPVAPTAAAASQAERGE